ncbi:class I adenylate-forming enzyme family protein [Actinomycetospora straminea]|uniref:Acyl-CoA synthetase (AMP-forming)/AMP-acid ligase II n=1 Tax=Actinomycetospora straminea TaxID=663607 RepID=A0ABP9DTE6_9PSEU|nr:class I adenylate-forming enzyme family protein [Actinomycetospora straminea]MDD7935257.1 class I adenylate-forming enzyme family protein [Actinomycetospora straminea]
MTEPRRPTLPAAADAYRRAGHWRDRTHLDDLRDELARDPDRTVLVDRSRGARRVLAVRDLADGVERLAAALHPHVAPGDRLAYRLSHRWETVALFHACGRLGAVAVPLPASLGPAQVEQRIAATGAVLVADDDGAGVLDLDDLPDHPAGDPPPPDREIGPDDVALVLFTSGTTGTAKAVLHTANTLHASTRGTLGALVCEDPGPDPRVMTPSVATHAIGVMTSVLSPLLHDHGAVLDDDGSPQAVLRAVHEEQVTHLLVGPSGYDALLEALGPDGAGSAPPSLRMIALGGAPLSRAILRKADRLPAVLRIHWGMTEVPGGGVSAGQEVPGTSWHTMGHAVPGLERELRTVPGGDEGLGEVAVRGPQVTIGLLDSADGRQVWSPLDDDGWYATGDIAERDVTGELEFVDRDSDEIKGSSGMIIPGAEVEDLIATHPDVAEVVLVAHHPTPQQEAPAAVVVPADGRDPTLDDLRQHLLDQGTTEWYLPDRLEIVDALPRDAGGKVDKKALRVRIDAD